MALRSMSPPRDDGPSSASMRMDGDQRPRRTALVLYGSETGTAHDVAEELGRMAERLRFMVRLAELNAVAIGRLTRYTVVLLAISTTGQGELPANAHIFWRSLLRKGLPATLLKDVSFALCGLGDSSYPKFNWAGRKLRKRLVQLGATEVIPSGKADEQHPEGTEGSLSPWISSLRQHLLSSYPLPEGLGPIPDDVLLPPKWILELASGPDGHAHQQPSERTEISLPKTEACPVPGAISATLTHNERVTPKGHWQDVRQLTLTSPLPLEYGPGDVLTIFPRNFPEDVQHFIDLMGWNDVAHRSLRWFDTRSTVQPDIETPPPIPNLPLQAHCTLRWLLTSYLDITSIPRRSFFSFASHYATDAQQKERLLEFTDPEFVDELYDYTTRPRRSILEVLQEFDSVKLPWSRVGNVIPLLRGRQFSIASGGPLKYVHQGETAAGTKFELLVAIVRYRTVIKKIREGVCTRYLASLPVGTPLGVLLRKGGLHATAMEARRPVILIAPGTGVAPMRSMLWERLQWLENDRDRSLVRGDAPANMSVLFFGGRNHAADFFYETEWLQLKERLDLRVFTAFSRDQVGRAMATIGLTRQTDAGAAAKERKIYVQDVIRQQATLVHQLLHRETGIVYVCGSSGKMPQAVREALTDVFQQEGATSRTEAESYLTTMENEGRYKQETW
ncbi:MAG: NAPDH-dependent diflavin reductase [Thelocarpon superellum]|nr:MAG: NAPDH-dependent diflavin reductase [Thelocarpon superellum]